MSTTPIQSQAARVAPYIDANGNVVTPIYVDPPPSTWIEVLNRRTPLETAAYTAITGACVYHGYRRNGSILWGLAWGLLGFVFPLPVGVIAIAQGFGKPAKRG